MTVWSFALFALMGLGVATVAVGKTQLARATSR